MTTENEGSEAICTLAQIDKILQSDQDEGLVALLIALEVKKFKKKTDVLTMNPGQVKP